MDNNTNSAIQFFSLGLFLIITNIHIYVWGHILSESKKAGREEHPNASA